MRNAILVFVSAFLLGLALFGMPAKSNDFKTIEGVPFLLDTSPNHVDSVLGKPSLRKMENGSPNLISVYDVEIDGHKTKTLIMSRRDSVVGIAVTYLVIDGKIPESSWVPVEQNLFVEFGEQNGLMNLVFEFPKHLKVVALIPNSRNIVEKPTLREFVDTNFKLMGVKFITKKLNPEIRG